MIYDDNMRLSVQRTKTSRVHWTDKETGRRRWAPALGHSGQPNHVMRMISLEAKGEGEKWPCRAVHQANLAGFAAFFPEFMQDAAKLGVEIKTEEGYSYAGWGSARTLIVAHGSKRRLESLNERHGDHLARFMGLLKECELVRRTHLWVMGWPYQQVSVSEEKQGKDCRRFDIIRDFFPHRVDRLPRQRFEADRFFEQTGAPFFEPAADMGQPSEMRFMTPAHAVLARLMLD